MQYLIIFLTDLGLNSCHMTICILENCESSQAA